MKRTPIVEKGNRMLLIDCDLGGGNRASLDLFDVFAALSRGELMAFCGARPHQRAPLHAFFVQVAALALHRAGLDDPPPDAEVWRELLMALTPDWPDGEAWQLIVEDWSKPALLQPPLPDPKFEKDYKGLERSADGLDMLVTSKNHDLKAARLRHGAPQDWFFALVGLQTAEGFMGTGNFGISRMNGGFGSRVFLGLRPDGGIGRAFQRDVRALLAVRSQILAETPGLSDAGDGLLWLAPWSGLESRPFKGLDPFYVEVCRRVRLYRDARGIFARTAGSKCRRIAAEPLKGLTGDPWAPLVVGEGKSWTPVEDILFDYRLMARMLDKEKITRPCLAEFQPGDPNEGMELVLTAVVRGQGKTSGFHERRVPISNQVMRRLGRRVALDRVGQVAHKRLENVRSVQSILRQALFHLFRKGAVFSGAASAQVDYKDKFSEAKIERWLVRFNADVDAAFFGSGFWEEVACAGAKHGPAWRQEVIGLAWAVLRLAGEAAPHSQVKRLRARADAEGLFRGRVSALLNKEGDQINA